MALSGNKQSKYISARRFLWLSAIAVGLFAGGIAVAAVLQTLRAMKVEASHHQAEMLAAAARASLQNDLLSSNFYLASERLKSVLEPHQWSAYCVSVEAATAPKQEVLRFGNGDVCANSNLLSFKKTIFFNSDQTEPAFFVSVRADPSLLPYKPPTQMTLILLGSVALIFGALGVVIYLSNALLDSVTSVLKGKGGTTSSLWISRIREYNAILQIVEDRDNQKLIAQKAAAEAELANALGKLASQVSHDIRSPLSALNMVISTLHGLPEDKRLIIRNAAQRINDIANQLLQKGRKDVLNSSPAIRSADMLEPIMVVALIDDVVSEKRLQFRNQIQVEILADLNQGYGLFARANAIEITRVISNLVNNSVEAITGQGRVTVAVRGTSETISIVVSDNGKGIPHELIAKLGERGRSHGKEGLESGSGLGIYHARETAESAGGKLLIQSEPGVGTIVTMMLPRASSPSWFVEALDLNINSKIVSLDDDHTIHQIWFGRLKSLSAGAAAIEQASFSSPDQFTEWTKLHRNEVHLYLIDYEYLGHSKNGLDIIENLGIAQSSVLVTSRYEERPLRERANRMGVRILPKMLASAVPIRIENECK